MKSALDKPQTKKEIEESLKAIFEEIKGNDLEKDNIQKRQG